MPIIESPLGKAPPADRDQRVENAIGKDPSGKVLALVSAKELEQAGIQTVAQAEDHPEVVHQLVEAKIFGRATFGSTVATRAAHERIFGPRENPYGIK